MRDGFEFFFSSVLLSISCISRRNLFRTGVTLELGIFLSFPMWSIPPLSLWNGCVFRVVTSPLTYQVLLSQLCNHASWIDMPLVTLCGSKTATLLGRHTSENGRQVAAAAPCGSLRLMTNLSGTHLAASISILSHHPAHALPDQENVRRLFLWCRPSGRKLWPLLPQWYS